MNNNNIITTEKPSERIRFALSALEEFENYKNGFVTKVDMETWHYKKVTGGKPVCVACLGGASALKRFVPKEKWIDVERMTDIMAYGIGWEQLFTYETSINHFRLGETGTAFKAMGLDLDKGIEFRRNIPSYKYKKTAFKTHMHTLANDLERAGF